MGKWHFDGKSLVQRLNTEFYIATRLSNNPKRIPLSERYLLAPPTMYMGGWKEETRPLHSLDQVKEYFGRHYERPKRESMPNGYDSGCNLVHVSYRKGEIIFVFKVIPGSGSIAIKEHLQDEYIHVRVRPKIVADLPNLL